MPSSSWWLPSWLLWLTWSSTSSRLPPPSLGLRFDLCLPFLGHFPSVEIGDDGGEIYFTFQLSPDWSLMMFMMMSTSPMPHGSTTDKDRPLAESLNEFDFSRIRNFFSTSCLVLNVIDGSVEAELLTTLGYPTTLWHTSSGWGRWWWWGWWWWWWGQGAELHNVTDMANISV